MSPHRLNALIIWMVVFFLAAMVGLRMASLEQERQAALAQAEATTLGLARVAEQYAQRVFETSDLVTGQVAMRVAALGGSAALRGRGDAHDWLGDLSERMAGDYLMVVDAGGRPVALSTSPLVPAIDLSDRRWFRAHADGAETHVGEALHSRITDEILFTYSRALRGADRRLDGVVQVAVRTGFFQRPAPDGEPAGGTAIGLFDAEGRVLARTGLTATRLDVRIPAPVQSQLSADVRAGTLRLPAGIDGAPSIASFRRLPHWGVVVMASVPEAEALAPWRRAVRWSVGVIGAAALVLLLLAGFAIRLVRREGEARAALASANAGLRDAATELERRVEARTRDLAAARDALVERETRLRALFDSTFQFIGLLTPDGTLLEANETALAFGGLTREQAVGRPFWTLSWWDTGEAEQARLRAAIAAAAEGEPQRYEAVVRGKGGRLATIDFSLRPMRDPQGRITLLMPEGHDLTELKAAEARLRESQKMEALGQLTGGVAHDFNNLLMAVLGNLALLRKRLPEEPRLLRLIDGAQQGAERGAALTQRLLAFARRQELRPQPLDMRELVAGLRSLLERSAGPTTTLRIAVPEGLPPALADANQLELALLNLVVNARDAMPAGGVVEITAGSAEAPGPGAPARLLAGRYLRLEVRDTGTGMDPQVLARATEPFFTTKGAGHGSGLGLSMVQGLAEQSGGGLALSSRPGAGTTVAIWLPIAEGAALAEPAQPRLAAGPRAPACRVLVVDDDPLVLAGTAMMLEDLGHRAVAAASAAEALALLAAQPGFDLVLTDFAMPGMTGLELAEQLRRDRPGLPVALVTGFAELPASAGAWLTRMAKPYRQEELADLVARLTRPAAA